MAGQDRCDYDERWPRCLLHVPWASLSSRARRSLAGKAAVRCAFSPEERRPHLSAESQPFFLAYRPGAAGRTDSEGIAALLGVPKARDRRRDGGRMRPHTWFSALLPPVMPRCGSGSCRSSRPRTDAGWVLRRINTWACHRSTWGRPRWSRSRGRWRRRNRAVVSCERGLGGRSKARVLPAAEGLVLLEVDYKGVHDPSAVELLIFLAELLDGGAGEDPARSSSALLSWLQPSHRARNRAGRSRSCRTRRSRPGSWTTCRRRSSSGRSAPTRGCDPVSDGVVEGQQGVPAVVRRAHVVLVYTRAPDGSR